MTYSMNVIGDRGSGKTLFAVWDACRVHQEYPQLKIVSNIAIDFGDGTTAIYKNDILRWMAVKLWLINSSDEKEKELGSRYANVIIDEAAIAGLESRGSSQAGSAGNTYLLMLARKMNIDFKLLTQMMSMIDKRGQWTSDWDILCEASRSQFFEHGIAYPMYFSYTFYHNLRAVSKRRIDGKFAKEYLYGKYDTNDAPIPEYLMGDFIEGFKLKPQDKYDYSKEMSP